MHGSLVPNSSNNGNQHEKCPYDCSGSSGTFMFVLVSRRAIANGFCAVVLHSSGGGGGGGSGGGGGGGGDSGGTAAGAAAAVPAALQHTAQQ